jgi:hypothetical protein
MEGKITEHYFEYETMKYFRGNAHQVGIGYFGEKKDPIGAKAYLAPYGHVKAEYLEGRVVYGTRAKVNWAEVSQAELGAEANLKFFGLGKKGAASFAYKDAKAARLELVNLAIIEGPLTKMLNKDADAARRYLAEEGSDGRIVGEVWVVVEAELGEYFDTYGAASGGVKAFGSTLDFTVSGGKQGAATITLSPGTTFAYKLYKVKDWNKDKTQVEKMEDDYKGMS